MHTKTSVISSTLQHWNPRLDKMVVAYATAASAAGVTLLAAAPPAEAKIVYTKTRVTITEITHTYPLDNYHAPLGEQRHGGSRPLPLSGSSGQRRCHWPEAGIQTLVRRRRL
jgi:hypothetical protein